MPIAPLNVGSETLFGQQLVDYGLNFIRVQPFAIPGFFTPAPLGCAERTVRVNLDSTALYVNGCSPQDVSKAVAAQSAVILSGQAKMVDREDNIEPSLRVANRRRMAHLLHSPWIHHILRKRCGD